MWLRHYQYRDPMLRTRRSRQRLIFSMGIPYLGKTVFILRHGPVVKTPLDTCLVAVYAQYRIFDEETNVRHLANDIFNLFYLFENSCIFILIQPKFVPKISIKKKLAEVHIKASNQQHAVILAPPWWYNMITSSKGNIFRVTGPLCGEFTVSGEFHEQWPVTQSFDVFFDLHPNKLLSKNCEAGDLRCHRAHYGVIVMAITKLDRKSILYGLVTWK